MEKIKLYVRYWRKVQHQGIIEVDREKAQKILNLNGGDFHAHRSGPNGVLADSVAGACTEFFDMSDEIESLQISITD